MINYFIEVFLILLLIFTPIAFASMDFWAFSLMELGILFMIILWVIQFGLVALKRRSLTSELKTPNSELTTPNSQLRTPSLILLALFLCLILFQMIPLPSGMVKVLSPKNYELRNFLVTGSVVPSSPLTPGSSSRPSALSLEPSALSPDPSSQPSAKYFPLSLIPFATQVEFFKWFTLIGFFLFLQVWSFSENKGRTLNHLILIIFLVGVFESLYGMFESFSGHHQALNIKLDDSSVAGTFISRNYFAGYLLMVIPLSIGYLLSREENQILRFRGWRHWLTSLAWKELARRIWCDRDDPESLVFSIEDGDCKPSFLLRFDQPPPEKPPRGKKGFKNPRLDPCPGFALGRVDRTRCCHQPVFHLL